MSSLKGDPGLHPGAEREKDAIETRVQRTNGGGPLLLMSPFGEKVWRMAADTALTRNRFVVALADTVLIAHAQPGSKMEQLRSVGVGEASTHPGSRGE